MRGGEGGHIQLPHQLSLHVLQSLPLLTLTLHICTSISTCRSTFSSISSSLVCPLFLGKPVSPVVSTSHSVPCTTASTSASTTSVVELFCPWNLPHIPTPSTNSLSSLSPSSHFTDGPSSPCTLSSRYTDGAVACPRGGGGLRVLEHPPQLWHNSQILLAAQLFMLKIDK